MADGNSESVQVVELSNNSPLTDEVKKLLREYGNYMYQDLGLIAGKENFFKELEQFPTENYLQPSGIFIIAKMKDKLVGCGGIKKFDDSSCEMKRLFVRSCLRGKGIGKLICDFLIEWCNNNGYQRILLDTNVEMKEAIILYNKCGFKKIQPYRINENEHPVFMEYIL